MKYSVASSIFVFIFIFIASVEAEEKALEQSMMLGLRTVGYEVKNLDEAVDWYTKAFGIEPYVSTPEYVGFNIRGFELGLMPETSSSPKGNNVLAYWGVENIKKEYKRLIKLGAKEHSPLIDVGGGIRLGAVEDPFGNILGIIYNPIFKLN